MKQRLFEDSEIPDINRQMTGLGTNPLDAGATTLADFTRRANGLPNTHDTGVPYPLDSIDAIAANAFLNVSNLQRDIEIAKQNPTLKGEKQQKVLDKLEQNLKDITKSLLDFDKTLSIIKGNE